jgi:hypothetical protein
MKTYRAGVPNILKVSALKKIVPEWIENTYRLWMVTKGWQEEQYAYIFAIANLRFKSVAR